MAEERERGFTVSDRRRFSSEADERESDASEAGGEPQRGGPRERDAGATSETSSPPPLHSDEDRGPLPEMTLSTFVMSLSTQVLMLLGEIPNPIDNAVRRDMVAAKQVIDILGMLKEKTRGNLESNEEALFENVLYDLRMRYVELAKSNAGR
jgi:hypothetical protein